MHLDGAPATGEMLSGIVRALFPPGQQHSQPGITVQRKVGGPAALAVLNFSLDRSPDTEPRDAVQELPQGPNGVWMAGDLRLDRPRELALTLGLGSGASAPCLALAAHAKCGERICPTGYTVISLGGCFVLATLLVSDRSAARCSQVGCSPSRRFRAACMRPTSLREHWIWRLWAECKSFSIPWGLEPDSRRSPGCHSLSVTSDGIRLFRAWRPQSAEVGRWRGSAADAAENLRSLVEESIACRLPAAGPVAAHLSGSLDSSGIAILGAQQLRARGRKLHTFRQLAKPSAGQTVTDEREYVKAVLAQEPDLDWSPVYLPPLDKLGTIDPDLPIAAVWTNRMSEFVPGPGCCSLAPVGMKVPPTTAPGFTRRCSLREDGGACPPRYERAPVRTGFR